MGQHVDVVIRTTGQHDRLESLRRAIASVQNQHGLTARPIVVLTGHSPRLVAEALSRPGIRLHQLREPTSPGRAACIGRNLVEADFYAFLDDDDELLPHALATRMAIMRSEPAIDLVVTSGYWVSGNERLIHVPDIARHQDDLIGGIVERCWLTSCGGLYRASSISRDYFDGLPDLCEWTWLAFMLAIEGRKIRIVDVPTYNAYDTPRSQSKSGEFLDAVVNVLAAMRAHPLPHAMQERLERKYRAALHDAAEHARQAGQLGKAWRLHLESMKIPSTLRYAAYTRKLLWHGGLGSGFPAAGGFSREPSGND